MKISQRSLCIVVGALVLVFILPKLLDNSRMITRRMAINAEFKKNLARELHHVYDQVVKLTNNKKPKLLLQFEEILQRLDNTIQLKQPGNKSNKQRPPKKDVCPEVFKGTLAGFPYYEKGWVLTSCTDAKPMRSVISILINTIDYTTEEYNRLSYVFEGITKSYPTVDIWVAIKDKRDIKTFQKYANVRVFKSSSSSAQTWNMLINKASTPYVLVARDVVHFSWLSQLERQIRVVSEIPNVGIAGGSYRNLSGHWRIGCFQSTMKNYVLQYQEGYFHSRNECMLCDFLQGPFVARKSILKFDENVNNEVIFEDLFLTLTQEGTLVMGCPDAMYFTRELPKKERKVWVGLAKKWLLNRIILPDGEKHPFTCKEIDFKCSSKVTRSYLLPVCCQEQYANALGVLQAFANNNNFSFELDAGSTLGTIKFNGLMPWDVDGDVRVLTKQTDTFTKKSTIEHFKKHGITLLQYEKPTYTRNTDTYDGYVKIQPPRGLYIEVYGRPLLTCPQFLPEDLKNNFTLSQVRGTWVKTVFSPGLFVRNRYGVEDLKHSQSWLLRKGMKHSYSDYKPGAFSSCENPDHHSCLQHFPSDGNIPFLVV